jgi:nitroreductase
MDVLEAIKQRRSIRQFTEQAIERELLEQILDAARWAPMAGNQQGS